MVHRVLLLDLTHDSTCELSDLLTRSGFAVQVATQPDMAARLLARGGFVLFLLHVADNGGPELDEALSFSMLIPRAVLSESRSEGFAVRALECGADSVLSLPISRRELAARLEALIKSHRRAYRRLPQQRLYHIGDLVIDPETHIVRRNGSSVSLTPKEFRLLLGLASRAGQVVSREQLLAEVWGSAARPHAEILRLYIRYLRQKLEDDHRHPRLLLNLRGVGYKLATGVENDASTGAKEARLTG